MLVRTLNAVYRVEAEGARWSSRYKEVVGTPTRPSSNESIEAAGPKECEEPGDWGEAARSAR